MNSHYKRFSKGLVLALLGTLALLALVQCGDFVSLPNYKAHWENGTFSYHWDWKDYDNNAIFFLGIAPYLSAMIILSFLFYVFPNIKEGDRRIKISIMVVLIGLILAAFTRATTFPKSVYWGFYILHFSLLALATGICVGIMKLIDKLKLISGISAIIILGILWNGAPLVAAVKAYPFFLLVFALMIAVAIFGHIKWFKKEIQYISKERTKGNALGLGIDGSYILKINALGIFPVILGTLILSYLPLKKITSGVAFALEKCTIKDPIAFPQFVFACCFVAWIIGTVFLFHKVIPSTKKTKYHSIFAGTIICAMLTIFPLTWGAQWVLQKTESLMFSSLCFTLCFLGMLTLYSFLIAFQKVQYKVLRNRDAIAEYITEKSKVTVEKPLIREIVNEVTNLPKQENDNTRVLEVREKWWCIPLIVLGCMASYYPITWATMGLSALSKVAGIVSHIPVYDFVFIGMSLCALLIGCYTWQSLTMSSRDFAKDFPKKFGTPAQKVGKFTEVFPPLHLKGIMFTQTFRWWAFLASIAILPQLLLLILPMNKIHKASIQSLSGTTILITVGALIVMVQNISRLWEETKSA